MQGSYVSFSSVGKVTLEPFEIQAVGRNEVLVETEYSVISPGTERANLLAQANTETASFGFPFRPGYSNVGRVIECGADVCTTSVGRRVATMASHQSHVVVHAPLAGVRCDWPYADGRPIDVSRLSWSLPDEMERDDRRACAGFIIAGVGLYGIRSAGIAIGERVVVVGLGPVGLAAGQFARLAGGLPVIGVAATKERRRVAENVGFDQTYASVDDLRINLRRDETPQVGDRRDETAMGTTFVEVTGLARSVRSVLKACPEGGRVILLGCTRGIIEEIDLYADVQRKALTIIGAHQPTRVTRDPLHSCWQRYWDADTALQMILKRRIDVGSFTQSELGVEDVQGAYATVLGDTSCFGVTLRWPGARAV